jgi:hypothetical protein
MANRFIDVYVEMNDEIPYDCTLRFHALEAPREVKRLRYRPDGEAEGVFRVESKGTGGAVKPVFAVLVDDSSAGTSTLIYGAELGLRLRREGAEADAIAEPYLLVDASTILG